MPRPELVAGWDIGGAHVKLALVEIVASAQKGGAAGPGPVGIDVAQWPCPLWQGLDHLHAVLDEARARWPRLAQARHAVTMTGEMVDLFEHREAGVQQLAAVLHAVLGEALVFWAGRESWCRAQDVPAHWAEVASANWAATATLAASRLGTTSKHGEAVLIDIGSTTTDLIALRGGLPQIRGRSDARRLASGELLYQGVVRTPLCVLAPRIAFRGRQVNVMNEFFATTADVHRLLGDLDPQHDQQPTADGGAKDLPATRRRLARMVGLDARDAGDADWLALAAAWREAQLGVLHDNFERVVAAAGLRDDAPIVATGCGDFLAFELARATGRRAVGFDALVLGTPPAPATAARPDGALPDALLRRQVQLAAPAVAVAMLHAQSLPQPSHEAIACGS